MRLTARTKTLVVNALQAVGYDYTRAVEKLAAYPTDRSCHTCGYFGQGQCFAHGGASIPRDFQERGCDKWDDTPTPF